MTLSTHDAFLIYFNAWSTGAMTYEQEQIFYLSTLPGVIDD
jgi:hypothetical protein